MIEEWKDIEGFEGVYQISSMGRVRSLKFGKERILKLNNSNGYLYVLLRKNGKPINLSIHRLVATYFIPNPENKPEVNHKNCKRGDNRVENLEWCTRKENVNNPLTLKKRSGENHPKPTLGKRGVFAINTKPIVQLTKKGEIIHWWNSITVASERTGIYQSSISLCCTGKYKSANGYKFMYADDYFAEWWDENYMAYHL